MLNFVNDESLEQCLKELCRNILKVSVMRHKLVESIILA